MRLQNDEKGGFLVEVILASALLLLVLLGSTYWLGRVSTGQGSLVQDSTALNQARLILEQEISAATGDPVGYLQTLQAPGGGQVNATLTTLPAGRYHLVRSTRSEVWGDSLIDLTVRVFWTPESGQEQTVTLFTSVHRR